ncbi:bifunctional 4-hydroxy-2-oxoglutarate aldolase/2-dehydro-3-deoxy-phosphogluconate aldolase [Roseimaritima ulvae]|uniref:bifunctional 4-hydroxy-2-oxoglutarate aldolase/2-dehydro-3-deoxy-phosphogluconate aldolase n=1 Tax=Roseimaritima ulvae TaxID=980254 RepID=UPI001EE41400|nr:bifunctional 4-hydroxy-2-oxoglutarate aldolase/2-dehydro-3-deoxy-phosphogluconate aldolase [Roseimaritima ulvae]
MSQIVEWLDAFKLVPVVALESHCSAEPLAEALVEGGLPCAEITLRTDEAIEGIRTLAQRDDFLVGAGTVHSVAQAQQVVDAGARFVVSPGLNPKTVQWCLDHHVPVFPGVSTPTDLEMALEFGLTVVKFFPAEAMGGVRMLRALSGPYGGVRFMPTGGIRQENLRQYLALPQVIACGGSWMVKSEWIQQGDFETITRLTSEGLELAGVPKRKRLP